VTAKDGGLEWLLRNLDAESYDALQLWIRWTLENSPMTRTLMRRPPQAIFYQRTPLTCAEVPRVRWRATSSCRS